MSFLEIAGHRHAIPPGESIIGRDGTCLIVLDGDRVASQHLIIRGGPDGAVSVSRVGEREETLINGVRLGPQPAPLLHGDKIEIGGHALHYVDEGRGGSTQFMAAAALEQLPGATSGPKPAGGDGAATGGRLVCLTDGREYSMASSSLVFGRDAGCDVVVSSKRVSRRHAEIVTTPKGYVLVDASTNGTFVNKERLVGERLLVRSDVIRIGDEDFRFYADSPVATPEPEPSSAPIGAAERLNQTLFGVPKQEPPKPSAPAPAEAPVGAKQRLRHTMHGIPAIAKVEEQGAAPATPSQPKPLAVLVGRRGDVQGKRFPIRVPIVNIGRADYNDVQLDHDTVSTVHAKLQLREGIWVLVDLDSTNGTFVDGDRVEGEAPLASGASVRFGDLRFVFDPTDATTGSQGSGTTVMPKVVDDPSSTDSNESPSDRQGFRLWPFK